MWGLQDDLRCASMAVESLGCMLHQRVARKGLQSSSMGSRATDDIRFGSTLSRHLALTGKFSLFLWF
ncbi:hypothetical protein KC19_1G167100 [Ceratodon purpureus]|uniref:Uncharacterized protein n=1 Tax=Ceratodon purpureus TaxID=3225 RepID=A0A8T0J712_CERPU|nr:hypothetical protein KC19_1G167100 [Ceratodon purpureus]